MRVPRKIKKQIPKNTPYCYTIKSGMIYDDGAIPYFRAKACHLYAKADNGEYYCKLFNRYDLLYRW